MKWKQNEEQRKEDEEMKLKRTRRLTSNRIECVERENSFSLSFCLLSVVRTLLMLSSRSLFVPFYVCSSDTQFDRALSDFSFFQNLLFWIFFFLSSCRLLKAFELNWSILVDDVRCKDFNSIRKSFLRLLANDVESSIEKLLIEFHCDDVEMPKA